MSFCKNKKNNTIHNLGKSFCLRCNQLFEKSNKINNTQIFGEFYYNFAEGYRLLKYADWLIVMAKLNGIDMPLDKITEYWKSYYALTQKYDKIVQKKLYQNLQNLINNILTNLACENKPCAINFSPVSYECVEHLDDQLYKVIVDSHDKANLVVFDDDNALKGLKFSNDSMQNDFVKVCFDKKGNLVSIFDKHLNQEIFAGKIFCDARFFTKKLYFYKKKIYIKNNAINADIIYENLHGAIILSYSLKCNDGQIFASIIQKCEDKNNCICLKVVTNNNTKTFYSNENINNIIALKNKKPLHISGFLSSESPSSGICFYSNYNFDCVKVKKQLHILPIQNKLSENIFIKQMCLFGYQKPLQDSNFWNNIAICHNPIQYYDYSPNIKKIISCDCDDIWLENLFLSQDKLGIFAILKEQYGESTQCKLSIGFRCKNGYAVDKQNIMSAINISTLTFDAFETKLLYFEL